MSDSLIYYRRKTLDTTEQSVVSNADGDSLSNDIVLVEGDNFLVLQVTSEQYKNLLSAAINGVFTTFPENPIGVLYPLIKAGKVSICDAIINCINDPESGLADKIYEIAQYANAENSRASGQNLNGVNLTSGTNPTCDLDILFGQAVQLVDYIDRVNTDFFEQLEVASNYFDFATDVIGSITGIDETSIDAVLEWITFVNESIAENYAAQVTETYKQNLACQIFCEAQFIDCAITPELMFTIMQNRLSSTVAIDGLIYDALSFLVDGSWSGSQIADFMFYAQFAFRSMIGAFLGQASYRDIQTRLVAYANDPNNDWTILCDECCDDINEDFDFTTDEYDTIWFKRTTVAGVVWVNGVGWTGVNPAGVQVLSPRYASITAVSGTYSVSAGTLRARIFQYASSTNTLGALIGTLPFTGDVTIAEDVLVVIDALSGTYSATLEGLHIEGCLRH